VDGLSFDIEHPLFYSIQDVDLEKVYSFLSKQQLYSGSILVNGQEYLSIPVINSPISIVPSNLSLHPHMSILDNMQLGMLYRADSINVNRVMEDVTNLNLAAYAYRIPKKISFFQKCLVATVRSFLRCPSLVVIDDMFSFIENQTGETINSIIQMIDYYSIPVLYLNRSHNPVVSETSLIIS